MAEICYNVSMSEEAKKLAFVAFCIESYKTAKRMDGASVEALFARIGADRYAYEEYDVLHTMGERAIVDDMDRYIEVRGSVR